MFLKRLDLQGFKTFATRTEFTFDSGITAIVGPNGSGKSNVADAVRWVLGEQSARPLRIKRSDDVIFAGSSQRARVGMAEVSITLDNSTKWLPVDFSEVTITRRAYRSGESEYLLNKSRVRLRDVVDMLLAGNIGQNSYTVIGQGQVDAALSLRAEERRELFEEAADIKRYKIKRNDALSRLQASDANLVRVRDLMAELSPRLQSLQEQAQRAHEQERLLSDLRGHLAAWYVHRWNDAADGLRRAILSESEALRAREEAEAALSAAAEKLASARQREAGLRAQLGEWHRQSSALHAQAEALERTLAVGQANLDAATRQQQEILEEIASLREQLNAQQQTVAEAEQADEKRRQEQAERVAALARLEQESAAIEERRRVALQQLDAAEREAIQAAAAIAAAESTLATLAGRRQSVHDDIAQRQAQIKQHQAAARNLEQPMAVLRAMAVQQESEIGSLAARREQIAATIAAARARYDGAAENLSAVRNERRSLELRLETLSRLHESMAGYDAGVRTVLNAARTKILPGVVGTVASLLRVPEQYQAAIGAALGSHEQDLVVDTWQAAEAAVEHLRQNRSGRATFLPLDVIKGRQPTERADAAIAWAADVVQVDGRYRQVSLYLLGRVLLVKDLNTARLVLDQPAGRAAASIVTTAGDIVRPGGAITGGSPTVRSSGLLERERELVDLPKRIQDERRKEQALDEQLKAIQNEVQQVERQLVALDGSLAGLQRASADQAAALAQRQRELERWQREIAWTEQQELSLRQALAGLDAQEASLTASLAGERKRQEEAHRRAAILRQDMAALGSDIVTRLAEARTAAALGEQEERAQQMLLSNRRREIERLAAQLSAKERRVGELAGQATALEATIESARREGRDLSASIVSMHQKIDPAERAIDDLEKERAALLERELQARTRYSALERAHSQTAVEVQRARNELGKLQAQIEAEEGLGVKGFGLEEQDVKALLDELAVPVQLSLTAPVAPDATYQQKPAVDPDVLKRRVDGLRVQLRRLGPVNPNAVKEYEETLGRYAFMTSQSEDLEKAVHSLRAIIGELDELMRTRFETTFEAIGKEFRRYFTALFGGGTARLTLTDPEDLTQTGIDIVAQPPGKRLQNLALLSGGERALAATALLFAILTVNPIPFCVLDEVDAALDDANVGRFCELLRSLSERTQFIVITHNKGTMETASSLYGVSMAADSTSQVLSLRLEDIPA